MGSAILSADDLNDFISPGVACIKPVETLPKTDDSNPYEVTTEDKVQAQNPAPASISLTDCLACSGCVTSAEAVLVSLQSHTEVLNTLDTYTNADIHSLSKPSGGYVLPENARIFVASISPQVRASIAASYGISEKRAGYIIEQFLSGSQGLRLGGHNNSHFQYVIDTNRMREACLALSAEEVVTSLKDKTKPRPVISSACPGWICYAEKTHPHVLPHLSGLKSPQALTGTLVKSVLSKTLNVSPSQIWHLAIMPCFDKKLEASREELTDKAWTSSPNPTPIRDVDCVITSRELFTLANSRSINLLALPQTPISSAERFPFPDAQLSHFLFAPTFNNSQHPPLDPTSSLPSSTASGTSGGYLSSVLRSQQALHPDSTIKILPGRNADVTEYTLLSASGTPLLKCARYYGFRNIQNLVRKLKPAKVSKMPGSAKRMIASGAGGGAGGEQYAYVEVMACPGGCTNGGGQIKVEDVIGILPQTRGEMVDLKAGMAGSAQGQREWLARVDEAYFSADSEEEEMGTNGDVVMHDVDVPNGSGKSNGAGASSAAQISDMLTYWSELVNVPLSKLAYTTYRKVESDVGKKKANKNMGDSERIAAIAGMSGGGW